MPKFRIRDFLNKLLWDPREDPSEYTVVYVSRGEPGDRASVNCSRIVRVHQRGFEFISESGRLVYIPFHRVAVIRKSDGVVVFRSPRHSRP